MYSYLVKTYLKLTGANSKLIYEVHCHTHEINSEYAIGQDELINRVSNLLSINRKDYEFVILDNSYTKLKEEFITLEKMYDSLWEEHELLKSKLHNEETLNNQKTYIIDYKHPQDDKNTDSRFKFKGKLDNFNPNGLCAFTNEEGVMLHVRYKDIIQMQPLKKVGSN